MDRGSFPPGDPPVKAATPHPPLPTPATPAAAAAPPATPVSPVTPALANPPASSPPSSTNSAATSPQLASSTSLATFVNVSKMTSSSSLASSLVASLNPDKPSLLPLKPEIDQDLLCPICTETAKEAFVTRCGHSFCYLCITKNLEHRKACPTCLSPLTRDQIFPNFTLNKLLEKQVMHQRPGSVSPESWLQQAFDMSRNLNVMQLNNLLHVFTDVKRKREEEEKEVEVLYDFLVKARQRKQEAFEKITQELKVLDEDLAQIESQKKFAQPTLTNEEQEGDAFTSSLKRRKTDVNEGAVTQVKVGADKAQRAADSLAQKKKRVHSHFDDLQACYFDLRLHGQKPGTLTQFASNLNKFTKFSRFNVTATLKYGDIFNSSSIVSSIEFDRDNEHFATAGVTKKIKIFEYSNIIKPVDIHYPIREMSCRSKISCLSWNSYIKSQIASSDYEGIVCLWDAYSGQSILQFEEHEKRAWSVDFSRSDPTRLASGSDDTKVKIWSTSQRNSVSTIESKANICCVRFNPEISHGIAFGSADHHIHYYDLRNTREPLFVFKGHKKAVSYVKFLNKDEVVSASTDSTLKMWNVASFDLVRTFSGHANEKNFVGLSVNEEYIACGSENNAVCTYHKALTKPILTYKFGSSNPVTGEESDEDSTQFVSSVCWKKNSNILLAANSQGTIKVLEAL